MLKVGIAINDNMLVQISLLEACICLLNPLHKQSRISLLPPMNEFVSNMALEQFEGKGGPIEAKEGRSACYFSVEDVYIIHHVLFGVALHESHCSSSGESWLCIFDYVLSGDQDTTSFSSSQILMRTQKGEVDLVKGLKVELMVAAIGRTVHSEQNLLVLSSFF